MRPKLALIALGLAAVGTTVTVANANAAEPLHTVCIDGQKTLEVTPENERTIREPWKPGPCSTTTTAGTGTTKPADTTTTTKPDTTTTTKPGTPSTTIPPVRATPHFTG